MLESLRQGIVLVGGRGTRLGALARDTPKPLLRIDGGRRFLDYVLMSLADAGVTRILLLAGHLGEIVEGAYQGRRVGEAEIEVVREGEPAGTGGALKLAADRLDRAFLMLNGDSLFDVDIRTVGGALSADRKGALALRQVEDGRRYGTVDHRDGQVTSFREKDPDRAGPSWISAGVYALRREVIDGIDRLPASIEADVFPGLAAEGRLAAVPLEGYFIDIGLPDTLEQARRELPRLARFAEP